jgi:hypothetical protein
MYQFHPSQWGLVWAVVAVSKEQALEYLIAHFKREADEEANDKLMNFFTDNRDRYNKWKNATVKKLPDHYKIRVFKEEEVMAIEFS